MSSRKFNKGLLASSIAMILAGGTSTFAMAAEEAQAEQETEVIEVTGIRGSLKENLNAKRFSNDIVDVITAEDVGKFPDKNVAETLSRIPGVAVSREFGEGEKITIRGAGPKYNRTLLNGQSVGTADWFILDEANRSFNYTMLPSVLVKTLEVHKSSEAALDEGSLGGTVILRTRRPLDLDANTVSLSAEAQYSETSGETDPQLAGLYSWKNEEESFGILVSAVDQTRTLERQGIEILGWDDSADDDYLIPRNIGAPRFLQERERQTFFTSLQWAPTDELLITVTGLNSDMDVDNQNANLLNFPSADRATAIANATSIGSGNSILATSNPDGRLAYNFINRVSSTKTAQYNIDIDYSADDYTVNFELGTTKGEGGTIRETSWEYNAVAGKGGYDYDLTSGVPNVEFGSDPSDGSNYGSGWIWGGSKPTTDEETWAQLDFEIPVEVGPFAAIKTGVKYRQAERTQDRYAFSWHATQDIDPTSDWNGTMQRIFATCPTLADCGLDGGGSVSVDVAATGNITQQVIQNRAAMEEMAFGSVAGEPSKYAVHQNLGEIWGVEEDILALYVQGDFEGDGFRGNLGMRYVSTDQASSGYEYSGDSWGLNTINGSWLAPSQLDWVTKDNDYSEFLPSFNIAFDLTDDQIFRFAAARVLSRQNWADISGLETYGSLSGGSASGTRGNPTLAPTLASQFDFSYEYYYNDASMFAATYFMKDLNSIRTSNVITEDRYDEANDVWVPVDFTQPVNGLGGVIQGVELNLQHDFGGYGVQVNYTYTDAEADEEHDDAKPGSGLIEGTSDHMYNLTAYYENDTFGARLMYNYRSEWYKGLHFNGDELYNDSYGQVDASASWNFNEYLTFTLEGVNLTDEEVVEYNSSKDRLMSIYSNGRRFVAGVRVNF